VTACPTLDGLAGEEVTVVVEAVVLTTSFRVVLDEDTKLVSPEYAAPIECVPDVVNAGAAQVATPLVALTAALPHPGIALPPSVNATVPPSGVGVTVAV
jgi:hypothetical protein